MSFALNSPASPARETQVLFVAGASDHTQDLPVPERSHISQSLAQASHPPVSLNDDSFLVPMKDGNRTPDAGPAPSSTASARPTIVRNGFVSVQVNVNAGGNNVAGDAANEPSIAVDPTNPNRMAIGWRQFNTTASNFREAGRGYTQNGGQSWTFPGVLTPGNFRSDPVLASDSTGQFFYYSLSTTTSVEMFRSSDGGVNWSAPVPAFGGDKAWMTIDTTGGMGNNHIYATWQRFFSCCDDQIFTRSITGGTSFQQPVTIPESPLFGTIAVGGDGAVYVSGNRGVDFQDFDTFVVARSSNAQNPALSPTFEHSTVVDMGGSLVLGDGPNPAGLLGQTWIATDHSNGPTQGNVYMLATVDPPGPDPADITFSRSTDRGATWSAPIRVNDDPTSTNAWQWFGTMSVAPNGRIDVVFNDTRTSGMDNVSETFMTFSLDGGLTWSDNIAMTPSWNSHIGWPNQNKIGDYYHMVSDNQGAHLAYSATFTGGQDVY
ncbi:MAG TPA: sialidase family protein, partial [Pirellulaceae bacterium]